MNEVVVQQPDIAPEERTLAVMTHLSGLAGYIIPLCGVFVPIIIWIVKSESKVISAIAKQAILLNVAYFLIVLITLPLIITVILIPVLIILYIVLWITAIIFPIVGAVKAGDGIYYRYPLVGSDPR